MWKKALFSLLVLLFTQNTNAFSDISNRTDFGKKVYFLVEKEILEDGARLKPEQPLPRILFWKTLLSLQKSEPVSHEYTEEFLTKTGLKKSEFLEPVSKEFALKVVLELIDEHNIPKDKQAQKALQRGVFTPTDFQIFNKTDQFTRRYFLNWVYNISKNLHPKGDISKSVEITETETPETKTPTKKIIKTSLQKIYEDIVELAKKNNDLTEEKKLKIYNAAIEAMFKEIGDEYGPFFSPKESKVYEEHLEANFVGIGIYVETTPKGVLIKKFLPNSPAQKAGLQVGDIIVKVGEKNYSEKDSADFLQNIRGKENSQANIEFLRNGFTKKAKVVRKKITVPSAEIEIKNGIPVIKISSFSNGLTEQVLDIAKKYKNTLSKGFIIDLRNNSGGYLNSAARLSSAFAKNNELMFVTNYQTRNIKYVADKDGPLSAYQNIIILQNKGSASSAEIFASFLQDSKRAKIYGQNSRGKGTLQQIKNYKNGASVKVTIGEWRTSKGESVNRVGITPDRKFEFRTNEEIKNKIDPVLNAAISDLK